MRLHKRGKNISGAEIQNISANGIWLLVNNNEYFLPYKDFPWFKDARMSEILNFEFLHGYHLHWPHLDVDLELDALEDLEKYPLVYKE